MPDLSIDRAGSEWVVGAEQSPVPIRSVHFDPDHLEREGLVTHARSGRGAVHFFELGGERLVLRHYWRGGFVGRINADRYLWTGLGRTRPLRELQLLAELSRGGLPVPRPVAARIQRTGLWYRGDLVTVEIPATRTLAARIEHDELTGEAWVELGRTIRRFHEAGAHHTDLNVRNILIDDAGRSWLIDWDKGRRRTPSPGWQRRTLARLRRSLAKEPALDRAAERHWTTLLRSWEAA